MQQIALNKLNYGRERAKSKRNESLANGHTPNEKVQINLVRQLSAGNVVSIYKSISTTTQPADAPPETKAPRQSRGGIGAASTADCNHNGQPQAGPLLAAAGFSKLFRHFISTVSQPNGRCNRNAARADSQPGSQLGSASQSQGKVNDVTCTCRRQHTQRTGL